MHRVQEPARHLSPCSHTGSVTSVGSIRSTRKGQAEQEIVNVGDGEVSVREQANFYDRVGVAPLPEDCSNQSHERDREEGDDKVALEPVFGLAAVENNLKAREAEGHEKNAKPINAKPAAFAGRLNLARELWRIGNDPAGENQRQNADGNIDKEDPAPTPVVRNPPTERRSDDRCGDDGHTVESESRRSFLWRKCVHENGLLDRSQPASPDTLQDAKEDKQAQ